MNATKFKFYLQEDIKKNLITEVFFDEHLQEVRQRIFFCIFLFLGFLGLGFFQVKSIVLLLQLPVGNVKFFQASPGEYFVSTLRISFHTALVFSIPGILSQAIFFLLPGLTSSEKKIVTSLVVASCLLLFLGLGFAFYLLIPAALNFFLAYSADVLEPFWSFDEYFSFVLVLMTSTGLAFQIPIVQVLLSLSQVLSGQKMLKAWKYILLASTVLGAILTPSADPLTQILLATAVFLLYLIGGFFSIWLTSSFSSTSSFFP